MEERKGGFVVGSYVGTGRERQLWKSSDRGKRCIRIKPARREAPWRLVSIITR